MVPILRGAPDRMGGGVASRTSDRRPGRPRGAPRSGMIGRAVPPPPQGAPPQMPDPISRTYLSLGAFYASDPARRTSRERDVGLFWRSEQGPTFRAAYVHDTGELYLFQHALGAPGGGSVRLFAVRMTEAELDVRLAGWEDVCGRKGSYEWLLERMGAAGPPPTPAPRPAGRRFLRGGITLPVVA